MAAGADLRLALSRSVSAGLVGASAAIRASACAFAIKGTDCEQILSLFAAVPAD